jgi:hypothetical protein
MEMSSEGSAISELMDVVRRCNPNLDSIRTISWLATGGVEASWRQWLNDLFEPLLLPHLRKVIGLASTQSSREIILLDLKLDRDLEPGPRNGSLVAGIQFLENGSLRAERLMAKMQMAIASGVASGHFATLYAVRCSSFFVPVRTAILSYLLQELMVGAPQYVRPAGYLDAAVQLVNESLRESFDCLYEGLRFHG